MACTINDAYISTIDYSVSYNLNTKLITITDTSTGANLGGVTGITYTMTAPNGVTGTLSGTIAGSGTIAMPTINGGVVYGFYTISAVYTDPTSAYTCAKAAFNICKPKQCDDSKNSDGCLESSVTFLCIDNKVLYADTTSYVYKDTEASDIDYDITVTDPNNVVQVSHGTSPSFIITPIVNGRYSFTIVNTATYDFDDSVSVKIVYQLSNQQYTAACDLNLCDAWCAANELYEEWKDEKGSGSTAERSLYLRWQRLSFLLSVAQVGIRCGNDVTALVTEIEEIAKVKCACGCGTTNPNLPVCSSQSIVLTEGEGIDIETTTDGDTTTFVISATGSGAVVSRLIANTAFVTSSGSDVTGTFGDFMKPFASIKKAVESTTSNAGHCVYVFPGTYNEAVINVGTNGTEKTGLEYYFSPGVTVVATGNNLWTSGIAGGSVVIRGAAILKSNLGVFNSTVDYDFDIECITIQTTSVGTNTCVFYSGGGDFRLKCSAMYSSGSSCMDIRTTSSTGYVECDLMDNQAAVASTPCVKVNTGGTHTWTFYVKELKTMSNAASNCAGVLVINTTAKVYWKGNIFQNQAAASGFCAALSINGGTLIFEGDVTTVSGHGALAVAGTIVLRASTIRAGGDWSALNLSNPPGTGFIIANNCMLVNSSATVATISHSASSTTSVQLSGCQVSNESATASAPIVSLTNTSQVLRMANCTLYVGGAGVSITTSVNVNTVIVNCMTNVATGGAGTITNTVSAITVDAQFIQTIYT